MIMFLAFQISLICAFMPTLANAIFQASIGPLSAMIDCKATVDNYGGPLSISVGLNPSINYYISTDSKLSRNNFQRVPNMLALGDEIEVAIKGQVIAEIYAAYLGGLGKFEFF